MANASDINDILTKDTLGTREQRVPRNAQVVNWKKRMGVEKDVLGSTIMTNDDVYITRMLDAGQSEAKWFSNVSGKVFLYTVNKKHEIKVEKYFDFDSKKKRQTN